MELCQVLETSHQNLVFAHFPSLNKAIRILHGWKFLRDPRKMLPALRKCTGNKLSSGYNFWPQLRFIVLFQPKISTKSKSWVNQNQSVSQKERTWLILVAFWQRSDNKNLHIWRLDLLWAICQNLRIKIDDINGHLFSTSY